MQMTQLRAALPNLLTALLAVAVVITSMTAMATLVVAEMSSTVKLGKEIELLQAHYSAESTLSKNEARDHFEAVAWPAHNVIQKQHVIAVSLLAALSACLAFVVLYRTSLRPRAPNGVLADSQPS